MQPWPGQGVDADHYGQIEYNTSRRNSAMQSNRTSVSYGGSAHGGLDDHHHSFHGFRFGGHSASSSSSSSSSAFSPHHRPDSPPLPIFAARTTGRSTKPLDTTTSSSSASSTTGPPTPMQHSPFDLPTSSSSSSSSGRLRSDSYPKYINDFSKALASEVRILLQEVGQLRDEKRALQYEIGSLMGTLSQYSPGGQYAPPEWRQPATAGPPALPAPEPETPKMTTSPPGTQVAIRPGWRTVNPRQARKQVKAPPAPKPKALPAPVVPVPPVAQHPSPQSEQQRQLPAWATWKPGPMPAPVARPPPNPNYVQGLFGPRTPPPH